MPAGLAAGGKRLWLDVSGSFEMRPDEVRILAEACHQLDLVDRMEAEVAKSPLLVAGSRGQDTPHCLIPEVRAHRLVLARLLRQLGLPDEQVKARRKAMQTSSAARKAAAARWHSGPA